MKEIKFETFDKFHEKFKGYTYETFKVCQECGGACEYNKISSLLPNEAEYIASKMEIDVSIFRDKYLDGVKVNDIVVDILKCSDPCPFLNINDYSCDIKNFKPLMCLIYPIAFEIKNNKWVSCVDDLCPLAQNKITRPFFENKGFDLVNSLKIDEDWIKRVAEFDEYDFDYKAMIIKRGIPIDKYKIYNLKELMSFKIYNNAEK